MERRPSSWYYPPSVVKFLARIRGSSKTGEGEPGGAGHAGAGGRAYFTLTFDGAVARELWLWGVKSKIELLRLC